jgi:hypothetical protein
MTGQLARFVVLLYIVFLPASVWGQGTATAAREAAEYVIRKFGKEAADEGLETLTRRMQSFAARYGDDATVAARKVGPRAFRLAEESGEYGLESVRLMAKYGDEAVWVVGKQNRVALCAKYGDDAAEAMMKHGEVAEPLIESLGQPAAQALKGVSSQNARRVAMMAQDGQLASIGRTPELLAVVTRYGDRALDFIWKNKGSLAVAAALAAFLNDPEPFLDGARDITKYTAESVIAPVAREAASRTDWTLIALAALVVSGVYFGMRTWLRRPRPEVDKASRHS